MKKALYISVFVALTGFVSSCGESTDAKTGECCHAKKECVKSDSCKAACEAAGKECKKDSACAKKCEDHAHEADSSQAAE